jgi:uncharacterized membrane protein
VAAVLFPPIGIGVAAGAAGGAAIGGIAGHVSGGMSRSDLKELGDTLDAGEAGLIVIYETNLGDQIKANIKAANRIVAKASEMEGDRLAAELNQDANGAKATTATS